MFSYDIPDIWSINIKLYKMIMFSLQKLTWCIVFEIYMCIFTHTHTHLPKNNINPLWGFFVVAWMCLISAELTYSQITEGVNTDTVNQSVSQLLAGGNDISSTSLNCSLWFEDK